MLKQGPPPAKAKQKKASKLVPVFAVSGLALLVLIFLLGDTINSVGKDLYRQGGWVLQEATSVGILAFLVGAIQAWVFKDNLSSEKAWQFVLASAVGGGVAGIVTGMILDVSPLINTTSNALMIGSLAGGIAGGVSSLIQNSFMKNKEESTKWFWYSLFSWLIIWAIGRVLVWDNQGIPGVALAAGFVMVATGFALYLYLPTTHIEF